ncbi:MAG TPA: hypothetical protein VEM93_02630 [Actinomycetota bacterium]|nr:hypothetical protein [Actinomycetota bacterium]
MDGAATCTFTEAAERFMLSDDGGWRLVREHRASTNVGDPARWRVSQSLSPDRRDRHLGSAANQFAA